MAVNDEGSADDQLAELRHRVRVLERRSALLERIAAFVATRSVGVLLLVGLLAPIIAYEVKGKPVSDSLLTFPWSVLGDINNSSGGATTSDKAFGTALIVGFVGLQFVAVWCCARLLFWASPVGIASKIAAWLLVAGCVIACLMFLLFLARSRTNSGNFTIEFGLWILLAGAIASCVVLVSHSISKWLTDALVE